MSWTLLVRSHWRTQYLAAALASIDNAVGLDFFGRKVMALDGWSPPQGIQYRGPEGEMLVCGAPWETRVTGRERRGLAANLQQSWDALGPDEWVFDVEEDFLILDAPLDAMRAVLEENERIANMVLVRQPVSPIEHERGVLESQPGTFTFHDGWIEHENGFWLNPSVFHSSTVKRYDAAVESVLTGKMRADGYSFGYWGGFGDEPRCTHIGDEGGMGSPGWLT